MRLSWAETLGGTVRALYVACYGRSLLTFAPIPVTASALPTRIEYLTAPPPPSGVVRLGGASSRFDEPGPSVIPALQRPVSAAGSLSLETGGSAPTCGDGAAPLTLLSSAIIHDGLRSAQAASA